MAIILQLVFAGEILCKDYDDEKYGRGKLVKTGCKAPIANMVYIKV